MYHFSYSDGVHLTAPMSRLYGEYAGYVMYKVLVEGVTLQAPSILSPMQLAGRGRTGR